MHWQAYQFVTTIKDILPELFVGGSVLEVGSHSVNGSIREIFETHDYTGLDLSEGQGVDIVISGHEYHAEKRYDVTISCECFEHNPFYKDTVLNMIEHTKEDGLIIFSCASEGRPEHGTSRTNPGMSPGTSSLNWDYYKNLTKVDFLDLELDTRLAYHCFLNNHLSHDLYFIGVKSDKLARKLSSKRGFLEKSISIFEMLSLDTDQVESHLDGLRDRLLAPCFLFNIYIKNRNKNLLHNDNFKNSIYESFYQWSEAPEINFLMSEIKSIEGDSVAALRFSWRAAQNALNKPFYFNNYASLLAKHDRYQSAISVLTLLDDFCDRAPLLWKASVYSDKLAKTQQALVFIDKALLIEANNAVFLNQKRMVLISLNRIDEARSYAKLLVGMDDCPEWIKQKCDSEKI